MIIERIGRTTGRWPKYDLVVDGVNLGSIERTIVKGGGRRVDAMTYDAWRIPGTTVTSRERAEQELINRGLHFGKLKG